MTTLDDFFTNRTEALHPRLRHWRTRLADADTSATLEVFRPVTELGPLQPEIHVQFRKNGHLLPLETMPWDDDLNAGLIHQMPKPMRAGTPEQEAERFALGLRAAFRKAEREFGDGYFNSVLVSFVENSEFLNYPEVAQVLKYTHSKAPSREGPDYSNCREMIEDAISGRAVELIGPLGYTNEEARKILISALARYLDDRFSVSHRRRLGLL
jgi:hypothetical protein